MKRGKRKGGEGDKGKEKGKEGKGKRREGEGGILYSCDFSGKNPDPSNMGRHAAKRR